MFPAALLESYSYLSIDSHVSECLHIINHEDDENSEDEFSESDPYKSILHHNAGDCFLA
jgi:hypothetical protein